MRFLARAPSASCQVQAKTNATCSISGALPHGDGRVQRTQQPTALSQHHSQHPQQLAAAALSAALILVTPVLPALAEESMFAGMSDAQRSKLEAAEQQFQQSETLKLLKERSDANRARNKKAIENKYCYRQAELGVGDCGGLRFIPGMTENGKQKTPDWLAKLLGVEQPPEVEGVNGRTLADLLKVE